MSKFSILSLVIVAAVLSGCIHSPQYARLKIDDWTELTCSGFLSWQDCKQEARAICPNGFYVADNQENYYIQRRVMSVACKA